MDATAHETYKNRCKSGWKAQLVQLSAIPPGTWFEDISGQMFRKVRRADGPGAVYHTEREDGAPDWHGGHVKVRAYGHEDRLPEDADYSLWYPESRIVAGARMFPMEAFNTPGAVLNSDD